MSDIEKMKKKAAKLKNPTPVLLPSGKWRCQVTVNGERVSFVEEDPSIAHAKALATKANLIQKMSAVNAITLKEAYTRYIESKDSILAPSTIAEYKRMQKNDLVALMPMPLKMLTQENVQREINKLSKNKSPKYVRNVHGLLSSVLKEYYPELLLKTTLPQKVKYNANVPDVEEIKLLLKCCAGSSIELPIYLSIWLGLRMSEIRGLRWDAYVGSKLEIKEAIVTVDGKPVSKTTKTYSSKRTITVPECIKSLIEKQPQNSDYIVTEKGTSIYRKFVRLCEKNDLPNFRFHDLRHANASVMLALGIPDKYAMERMGHATNNMLKTVYQHTMEGHKKKYWDSIDKYFESLLFDQSAHESAHEK